MFRPLCLLIALALLAPVAAAQGFWAPPDDDPWHPTMGPPVLAGSTMEETASEFGRAMREQGTTSDNPMDRLIWWMVENLTGHIPVDPNCPPPNGCPPADDPPAGGPPAGDPPAGDPPAGDPPAGDPPAGDPPAGNPPSGGDPAPPSGGSQPQALSSASGDGYDTFRIGDGARALAVRTRFQSIAEGAFVPDAALPDGARLRLVSRREADRTDRGEFQLRFEVVRPGRAQAIPVLVQAGGGHMVARVAARADAQPRQRGGDGNARQGRRGRTNR
jgi:hypothetical protein